MSDEIIIRGSEFPSSYTQGTSLTLELPQRPTQAAAVLTLTTEQNPTAECFHPITFAKIMHM